MDNHLAKLEKGKEAIGVEIEQLCFIEKADQMDVSRGNYERDEEDDFDDEG